MRAYVQTGYGDGNVMELRDVPEPEAGPGEVLIKVHAVGLNPLDYKIRRGDLRAIKKISFPKVAGNELTGVVASVGEGVTTFVPGDRVFARVDKDKLGAFAEYATVRQDLVAKLPDSLDFVRAAALPLAGLTALQALRDELAVSAGDRIFISGGAGGVGTLAIQLAKWLGAEVATTASPRGAELVRSLGADHVIDYTKDRFTDVLRDYDGAFDLIGGGDLAGILTILKPGAKVVSIAGPPEPTAARGDLSGVRVSTLFWLISAKVRIQARRNHVDYRYLFMHGSGTDLALLAGLVDDRTLTIINDRDFPFEEIADAFAHLEQGRAKGKVVVRMV